MFTESFEARREASAGTVFKCEQSIVLCPNGAYTMRLSDIATEGAYVLDGAAARGERKLAVDGPKTFTPLFADDGSGPAAELPGGPRLEAASDRDELEQMNED